MDNEYGPRKGISESPIQAVDGDETEDMLELLMEVLVRRPLNVNYGPKIAP